MSSAVSVFQRRPKRVALRARLMAIGDCPAFRVFRFVGIMMRTALLVVILIVVGLTALRADRLHQLWPEGC
jgi:hypothetical protein